MQKINKIVVEVTLDEIKETIIDYWITSLQYKTFSRDIVVESGMTPISEWSSDALLAFYTDLNLADTVREVYPGALVLYRKASYDLVDLSSHIDEFEELKQSKRLDTCKCGNGESCCKLNQC